MKSLPTPTPLMTIQGFCAWSTLGRTKTYAEINAGRLKARKIGGRTLISHADAVAWLEGQPAYAVRSAG